MNEIIYIERSSGKQKTENVPSGAVLRFLYGNALGRLTLQVLFKRKILSALGGWYMNRSASKSRIEPFCGEHHIDLADYEVPEGGYSNFNSFFFRKIKTATRPISEDVCSPADGKILVFDKVTDQQKFFIKGGEFDLNRFIGDKKLAEKYENGAMAIVRLAPPDYHRFHFPVSGEAGEVKRIKGWYYSVSPIALRKSLQIFMENKREHVSVKSPQFGDVLIMDVGATMTGSIIQTFQENSEVKAGDEKGYFAFGGSTTVLLFEKNKVQFSPDLVQNSLSGFETTIKMGEQIASAL